MRPSDFREKLTNLLHAEGSFMKKVTTLGITVGMGLCAPFVFAMVENMTRASIFWSNASTLSLTDNKQQAECLYHDLRAAAAKMKTPPRLAPLLEYGLIDEVVCQLMSGKEAQIYIVMIGGIRRCAKVFKEANKRSFKQAVQYQEGRSGRNSRRNRAMSKKTKYGQQEQEQAWLNAEVDALRLLKAAGVRVPEPLSFIDGVLLMELITDAEGITAPRLGDNQYSEEQALDYHYRIIREVVRMLCAGLVHGDLSPFNVLVDAHGPVIIDLPQAVNAAGNNSAEKMLLRDVANMRSFFGNFAPSILETDYGSEIWTLFEAGELHEKSILTGEFQQDETHTDLAQLFAVIEAAKQEEEERLERAKTDSL